MTSDEIMCRQFVELVTDYFEGALGEPTLTHIEEHLVICDWCVTYAEQIEATIHALSTLRRDKPSAWLQQAIATALRDKRSSPEGVA